MCRGQQLVIVMLIVLAFVCAPSGVRAAVHDGASTWLLADANKRFNVSGVVESVNYVSNTMRVNANGQNVQIVITPTSTIELKGEAGSIADIRRGSKITATGVIRDGTWIANSIIIH
jgi:hypothetical protein